MSLRSLIRLCIVHALALSLGMGSLSALAGERVKVFAAASLTDAVDALAEAYERDHDVEIVPVYAASSTLARQIANGAPAEIYLSANEQWMDWLGSQEGVPLTQRHDVLNNRLALIAPRDSDLEDFTPDETASIAERLGEGRLALGNPEHVPAGIYAKQALTSLGQWTSLAPRLARADNVRSALALVERGEAPLGIVYASDAQASDKVETLGLFPDASHEPIIYPMALIGDAPSDAAKSLADWLDGRQAAAIFQRFGFTTVAAEDAS
ncbi:molybdate ABC transporter substrate-binding protein [Chromohalobacter sp. TMW 2.2308]|uniref:molybdate ABC transporter substrate-binding protein n=1 Tax=Chromohalobacter TaxID=42054 RepID=UPI00045C35F8|nr:MULTISPECIES: molybdate ABC transporter substrate-binding protein [Chromohalobacter]MCK2042785.1 molybdate ABC transporter substrate-binding protein [Chromohalobacter moromii]MCT8514695.1 molybdate ABC transporter substrate-binding protein [Chromohalobacter sp. TMW 2.2271]CDQ35033.1 Molybdate-binding periplasmic protein precursor [Virgibacillus halodenitrificans]